MKKLVALILALVLCLSCTACGGRENSANNSAATTTADTDAPDAPGLPTTNVQSITGSLNSVLDQITALQAEFEAIIGYRSRGPLLNRASEYYVTTDDGKTVHGLLLDITADVGYVGALNDHFQIGVDLLTGEVILSCTEDYDNWMETYDGNWNEARDILMCCIGAFPAYENGGTFYFPQEQIYDFSAEEIDHVNADLGWEYIPYPEDVPTEEITSSPEDRIAMVSDGISRFLEEKGDTMLSLFAETTGGEKGDVTVTHAMEYRLGSMDGYPIHGLLINLEGNFAFDQDGELLMNDKLQLFINLETGMIYDSFIVNNAFFENFTGICQTEEDVAPYLLNLYANVASGDTDTVVRSGEESAMLTAEELAQVNAALAG